MLSIIWIVLLISAIVRRNQKYAAIAVGLMAADVLISLILFT